MAERFSRRKFLMLVGFGTGAVAAGALGVKELLSSGNGKGKPEVKSTPTQPTNSPAATETIAPTPTAVPTEAPTVAPKPISPEDAKPILGVEFATTKFETARESIQLAYQNHHDAEQFLSQGQTFTSKSIVAVLDTCETGDRGDSDVACAGIVRILYGHYMQSGYEEFYQAAVDVYNSYFTAFSEREQNQPDVVLTFSEILTQELELNNLLTK